MPLTADMEAAVASRDFERMVRFVLDGHGDGLKRAVTDDDDVKEFIDNIPAFQVSRETDAIYV